MTMRKWLLIGILLLFAGVAGLFVVLRHVSRTVPTFARKVGMPLPVKAVEANRIEMGKIYGTSAVIQPIRVLTITNKIKGDEAAAAVEIYADIGDNVLINQVLVRFDREFVQSVYEAVRSARDHSAEDLKYAEENLRRIRTSELPRTKENTARSEIVYAEKELERAKLNLRRIQAVCDQNLLPESDLEKAKSEAEAAAVRCQTAKEKLLLIRKEKADELDNAIVRVSQAKIRYKEAEEKFLTAQKNLHNVTLISPVTGIVTERRINPGETPVANQPLFLIGQTDPVLAEAAIPEEHSREIFMQMKAEIVFAAFPDEIFKGEIVRIAPVTDSKTRTFSVYVRIANSDFRLKPGQSGFVRIQKEKRSALAVPSIALINPADIRNENNAVFVVGPGNIAGLRKVRVGISSEGMTEIREGLSPGDKVVTVGQFYLKEGDKVRIGNEFNE